MEFIYFFKQKDAQKSMWEIENYSMIITVTFNVSFIFADMGRLVLFLRILLYVERLILIDTQKKSLEKVF